ncbi:peptide N-acetyl-beta-D-glucosaminyl asparaginase amidase A-domain-containing protein [Mycena galericulata]|nr:peptide N-acetyl-beta-D-glucosaminyl asparaginase amidase A-domain-containing protein [Mycena galericulata]
MVHTFGNSYGAPYVGDYTPPSCEFNSVVITFTATVAGRQYDRLSMMYLTDTEVWRMSTAEPTKDGIVWTYVKDMTAYLSLWKQPQTLVFELDNIVDSTYTGLYNTTLTATFFTAADAPVTADAILPISSLQGSAGKESVFQVPEQVASVKYSIPANVSRAAVSISANGQINEEFWYTNVFSSQVLTFNSTVGALLGGGPFREVQLLIDGYLAGVVWPFPVIFTGGVVPGLWRPIVGIQAFDLAESEIDITPFLPYLTDGKEHNFTIGVFQLADDNGSGKATLTTVEPYWEVTGKIFLFYGDHSSAHTGSHAAPTITGLEPDITVSSKITAFTNGTNATLSYSTDARRTLSISSPTGSWTQTLSYTNTGLLTAGGFTQTNTLLTTGAQRATDALSPRFNQQLSFRYPVTLTTTFAEFGSGITIDGALTRGLSYTDSGRPDVSTFSLVAGPAALETAQEGTGRYSSVVNASYSFGSTRQSYAKTWGGGGETYARSVSAVNGSVVQEEDAYMWGAPRGLIGRGSGTMLKGL